MDDPMVAYLTHLDHIIHVTVALTQAVRRRNVTQAMARQLGTAIHLLTTLAPPMACGSVHAQVLLLLDSWFGLLQMQLDGVSEVVCAERMRTIAEETQIALYELDRLRRHEATSAEEP